MGAGWSAERLPWAVPRGLDRPVPWDFIRLYHVVYLLLPEQIDAKQLAEHTLKREVIDFQGPEIAHEVVHVVYDGIPVILNFLFFHELCVTEGAPWYGEKDARATFSGRKTDLVESTVRACHWGSGRRFHRLYFSRGRRRRRNSSRDVLDLSLWRGCG